ncbi:MAG: alpha-amylase family glycosyl hydrolase, partial [Thermoprotei archaeon]
SMNYTLRNSLLKLLLTREIDLKEFIEEVYTLYYKLPVYVANSLYTLLGSHDTPRIKTLVKRFCGEKNVCKRLLYLLYAILFAFYGSPAIYYGDEIGMENGSDIQARKPMIWNTDYWDKELLEFIKELTELRKRYQSLRQGFTILNNVSDKILLVKRFFENEEIHGYFNMYHDYVKATLYEGEYRVLLSRGAVIKNGEVFMEPYGFLLVKIKR